MASAPPETVLDRREIAARLDQLAGAVARRHPRVDELGLVGIRTGGAHLSARLGQRLAALGRGEPRRGVIDITLYRDDWTKLHARPKVGLTEIDFPVEDRVVILVDDVLFTGRTVRAALDELIDFGRPRRIELAVLIDRGHRELPIQPDYVGQTLETRRGQVIDVELTEGGAPEDRVVRLTP
jgi:pyrimidine operon attenuation protein/uracil phosphoribosyltransferase